MLRQAAQIREAMRATGSAKPLAGNLAWWLMAFIFVVFSLATAIAGGSLLGEWSNAATRTVAAASA